MPQTADESNRRRELLDATVDYIRAHGLADLSLRPLAAAAGTSARMLVYHFGSKEQLIAAALDGVRERQQLEVAKWIADSADLPPRGVIDRFWQASTEPDAEAYGRLFFEAYGMALIDDSRLPGFLDGAVHGWLEAIAGALRDAGYAEDDATAAATALLAIHRGLLLDLFATGERGRVDAGHRLAVDALVARVSEGGLR
ncbi:TetR/AcrR family transcriptional regulator [Tsukamurella sp. 8F]|uniref:TetR/AcrR family transcriptional regulator n=1 Tax=unclassified Tsukamurella TaxID=2633480 RepID=UPI0023B91F41|nr:MULTISPECIES: TetR/AcrR family transcriptional regulator [unclassified Tsukamurella]MDF0529646.1 TetR/AcrR family transcriptional regulator [Tsukamurella sp. 8J]MDF0585931.1 TetR/AcrR family transcriptional regulator [Tsukamurella sp. 8F]